MRYAPRDLFRWAAAAVVLLAVSTSALLWWIDGERRIAHRADAATGGVGARAVPVMLANGCAGCHTIPGVPGTQGLVGPRLDGALATRVYIGGVLPNTPENMIHWLRASREIHPKTAMPSRGISEQEARDVAAYFYALR